MKTLRTIDMQELTRLTREGRLNEAMALLQGGARETDAPNAGRTGSSGPRATALPQTRNASSAAPDDRAPSTGSPQAQIRKTQTGTKGAMPFAGTSPHDRAGFSGLAGLANFGRFPGLPGLGATAKNLPLPDGASFETLAYSAASGTRRYKLYIPASHDGSSTPLVVMLHGCTQSPDDFAAGTRMNELAEERGFLVAYPEQTRSANAQKCWNWFEASDQRRDAGEPALIAGITRQIVADHAVDPGRVFIAGLSAGGATAAIMGQRYPDLFAAVGVHSGLACGAARDMASAFAAMRGGAPVIAGDRVVPTIVFHGDRDTTVAPINGERVLEQARAGITATPVVSDGVSPQGIAYTRTVHREAGGRERLESWCVHGASHAWSGGSPNGSYTLPAGPNASAEMLRFFLDVAG